MHIHHDHVAGGAHTHEHDHAHTHEHTHDGVAHTHEHSHSHSHDHAHPHDHEHLHDHGHEHHHHHDHEHHHHHDHEHHHHHDHEHHHHHDHEHHHHDHSCSGSCQGCASQCEHTPLEELMALMKYMVGHNASHARELADLAAQLEQIGSHSAYEQVMAAVSDFEKGNMRLSVVLSSLQSK